MNDELPLLDIAEYRKAYKLIDEERLSLKLQLESLFNRLREICSSANISKEIAEETIRNKNEIFRLRKLLMDNNIDPDTGEKAYLQQASVDFPLDVPYLMDCCQRFCNATAVLAQTNPPDLKSVKNPGELMETIETLVAYLEESSCLSPSVIQMIKLITSAFEELKTEMSLEHSELLQKLGYGS